jgi:hypothetical protein
LLPGQFVMSEWSAMSAGDFCGGSDTLPASAAAASGAGIIREFRQIRASFL